MLSSVGELKSNNGLTLNENLNTFETKLKSYLPNANVYLTSSIAGDGVSGSSNGISANAEFSFPSDVALSEDETVLFVVDSKNNAIRKIDLTTRNVSTVVTLNSFGWSTPQGIAIDVNGYIYISDLHRITMMDRTEYVTVIAGSSSGGLVDGTGGESGVARFNIPKGIAIQMDTEGYASYLYVSDFNNAKIRRIRLHDSYVSTIASVSKVWGIVLDAANSCLYAVSSTATGVIHQISIIENNTTIPYLYSSSVLAGGSSQGSTDGSLLSSTFYNPTGIAMDSHRNVYISDSYQTYSSATYTTTYQHSIRRISLTFANVSTMSGKAACTRAPCFADGNPSTAKFMNPQGIAAMKSGNFIYVADYNNYRIRSVGCSQNFTEGVFSTACYATVSPTHSPTIPAPSSIPTTAYPSSRPTKSSGPTSTPSAYDVTVNMHTEAYVSTEFVGSSGYFAMIVLVTFFLLVALLLSICWSELPCVKKATKTNSSLIKGGLSNIAGHQEMAIATSTNNGSKGSYATI